MFPMIPIDMGVNVTPRGTPMMVAPGTNIQLQPHVLYQTNNKLFALAPSGAKTIPVYNDMASLMRDYDTFTPGQQVYIKQAVFMDPRVDKQYIQGATRGSIIVGLITAATIILIIKLIIVIVVVAGIIYCVAQLTKTPVTTTKKVNENVTAVTAPDGTTWLVDNRTGEVIDETTGTSGIFQAAAGLIVIGAGTYVGVKYIAPALGKWWANRKRGRVPVYR